MENVLLVPRSWHSENVERNIAIARLYMSAKFTVEHIARQYGLTPRAVQRIVKAAGVSRTQAEANRVAAPLKHYHRIPKHLRVNSNRKSILRRVRYKLISSHPYCTTCGLRPDDGIRLEIDHIDNDPSNNVESNFQVLCQQCNVGKSGLTRWGTPDSAAS